ncbi:MAG: hypothetical protein EHM28_07510 [Spirochaetaceae bacterium]|nr:MAG: hypothetical protein EHM28_07510 [Spirochaetaceae bacterium]
MKILRVLFLLLVFPVPVLMADLHLSVDVNDPAYMILEMAEIKGAIYSLSRVKPYTAETIYSLLSRAQSKQGLFSADESAILGRIIQDLEERFPGLPGNPAATDPVQLNPVYPGPVRLGFWEESLFQINANNPKNWHMYNALRFFMAGDVGDFLSWYGNVGFTYDKVGPDSFAPYSFTKEWDGFHIGFGEPRYSMDGVEPIPYLSFILENEITAEFFENSLTFKFARYRRDWSIGDGSLLLSKTARPFEGFDFSARLADWISLSYTVGSLGNWMEENQIDSDDDLSSQKMFTAQILEFFPFTWLSFSAASSAVWGKRFELGYLSPLMYTLLHQNLHGDMDNVMLELEAEAFLLG